MVARSGKHTCFPFCVRERALVAIEAAWAPFGIFPPLLRVDPTPGVGQGGVISWGSEEARPAPGGSGEA
jgi:hypothetical protein